MHTKDSSAAKAKVEAAQAALEAQLAALQTGEDWKRTLEAMAVRGELGISRFSFRNFILLQAQCPGLTHAATFKTWQRHGRQVKKGAKALTVLRPHIVKKQNKADGSEKKVLVGFAGLPVFALEQTEGAPVTLASQPEPIDTPEGFTHTVEQLQQLACTMKDVAGIELRARQPGDSRGAEGWFNPLTKRIVVITGETSQAQQCATLFHELAHAILHGETGHHRYAVNEVEAESTAFVVAHTMGLDTSRYTLPYVTSWATSADKDEKPTVLVARAGENIRRAANTILDALLPPETSEVELEAA